MHLHTTAAKKQQRGIEKDRLTVYFSLYSLRSFRFINRFSFFFAVSSDKFGGDLQSYEFGIRNLIILPYLEFEPFDSAQYEHD